MGKHTHTAKPEFLYVYLCRPIQRKSLQRYKLIIVMSENRDQRWQPNLLSNVLILCKEKVFKFKNKFRTRIDKNRANMPNTRVYREDGSKSTTMSQEKIQRHLRVQWGGESTPSRYNRASNGPKRREDTARSWKFSFYYRSLALLFG